MIRILSVLAVFATLAACGADGEPVRPSANLNIGIGSGGVHTGASVGVSRGPITVGVGIF
jgi:hypothetical protein